MTTNRQHASLIINNNHSIHVTIFIKYNLIISTICKINMDYILMASETDDKDIIIAVKHFFFKFNLSLRVYTDSDRDFW